MCADRHAIDEAEYLKASGYLTYYRSKRCPSAPDQAVVETVSVELHTPTDPTDRCVERIDVEWTACPYDEATLYPRLKADRGALKMLAMYPSVLWPLLRMEAGRLSADDFVAGLVSLGIGRYKLA